MSIGRPSVPKMTTLEMRARLHASIGDRFSIERTLGEGDLATAYLARDLNRAASVVIKVLKSNVAAALGAERFLRETHAAVAFRHPNILPLLDAGDANGMLYYVLPVIEGHTLRDALAAYGEVAVEDAFRIVGEVAAALDYAHARGVVHRDLRPDNIMLQNGRAIVAEFGVGSALASIERDAAATSSLSVAMLAYMSPEEAAGDPVDGRADLYSLACVLYEMLVGEPPFAAPTVQAVVAKRFVQTPESVAAVRETIPPPVARALQRALARSPADRPPTATAFAKSLRDAGGAESDDVEESSRPQTTASS